jgi:hypothetical protein
MTPEWADGVRVKYDHYYRAVEPNSKQSCQVVECNGLVGFEFHNSPQVLQYIACTIPIQELADALEAPPSVATNLSWMCFELLRRYCNHRAGNYFCKPVPFCGESRIDRYFREHPEAL